MNRGLVSKSHQNPGHIKVMVEKEKKNLESYVFSVLWDLNKKYDDLIRKQ